MVVGYTLSNRCGDEEVRERERAWGPEWRDGKGGRKHMT